MEKKKVKEKQDLFSSILKKVGFLQFMKRTLAFLIVFSIEALILSIFVDYTFEPDIPSELHIMFRVPMILLVASYYVGSWNVVAYYMSWGKGLSWFNALFDLLGGVLSITGCLILVPKYGLVGAAAASLLGRVPVPVFIHLVQRKIGIRMLDIVKGIILPTIIVSVISMIIMLVLSKIITNIYTTILGVLIGLLLIPAISWVFGIISHQEKSIVMNSLVRKATAVA